MRRNHGCLHSRQDSMLPRTRPVDRESSVQRSRGLCPSPSSGDAEVVYAHSRREPGAPRSLWRTALYTTTLHHLYLLRIPGQSTLTRSLPALQSLETSHVLWKPVPLNVQAQGSPSPAFIPRTISTSSPWPHPLYSLPTPIRTPCSPQTLMLPGSCPPHPVPL